ncbi:MAG TPA: N-methyl-L-tryptophan oxidase [Acetobacteraceae bacterium]
MTYDTIVIGLGAMGAATLLQLARRGQRVLGLDRWDPPHAWGSTHGDTRITRCAIGEGEQYVPLVLRSHEIWREIEAETGETLLNQCGAMILAPAGSTAVVHGKPGFVRGTIAAAKRYAIPHEVLDAGEAMRRYPQFRLRGDELVYYEPGGGYVRPEACVGAQLALARRHGAEIRPNTPVAAIARDGAGVRVTTAAGDSILAAEAVLAAGAWSPGLAGAALAPHMAVTRQVLHWFSPADPAAFAPGRCPVYIWTYGNTPEEGFYGFPVPPGSDGVKIAMEQYQAVAADPDHLQREVTAEEAAHMHRAHLAERMPGLLPDPLRSVVCPYTMTRDGDFLVSRAPENDRVLLVSACSGHGFKHSAGLGEAVAEMVAGAAPVPALAGFTAGRLAAAAAA